MKKIIGLAVLLLSIIAVQAQDHNIGLRVGYQNSRMLVDGSKLGSSGNSIYVNAYKDTQMLPFLFFHSGLQYSQSESTIENMDYRLNYLGAPVGLKVKLGPVNAIGGAAFNVKLNEKNSPFEKSAKWYDTNAFLGAGFNILFLNVDARYVWGLTNINNGIHNNGFQIGLGLRF
ncbi:outer membrane beta-barrel protein [Prolixibacteraceae bacterium Z1-6]|uniref:Outer membrane beta-barrel protein n=1 Tax=Draconibacterium aestuarii TaxID=2998507 RepID=A0A9X3J8E7_9BACT|nr:outer membrane beta-barrel protein [Prolixibacteraceae bacterium Z1-6]